MTHRLSHLAAAVALTTLSTVQAFALTPGQTTFNPQIPQIKINVCFTRIFFTSTSYSTQTRQCDIGEKPGSVKAIYVG